MSLLPKGDPFSMLVGVVDSVQEDGTVNVLLGGRDERGDLVTPLPCNAGYWPRAAGDKVWCINSGGMAFVVDKIDAPDRVMPDIPSLPDVPPKVSVSWGTGVPGTSGWQEATKSWYRDDGQGKVSIYAQLPTATPPPSTDEPAAAQRTVKSSGWSAWRGSSKADAPGPKQSQWSGPAWTGAWYFPSLQAQMVAPAGSVINNLWLHVTRSATPHGVSRGAQVGLYLISASDVTSSPPARRRRWEPGALSPGQAGHYRMPDEWVADLKAGTAKGIACYGTSQSEYIIFKPSASVDVTFTQA